MSGATTPLLMVKQGQLKYVYSAVDPEQLFDLVRKGERVLQSAGRRMQ